MDSEVAIGGEMMVTILVAIASCVAVWAFFRWFNEEMD
jgi:hypothetical protein